MSVVVFYTLVLGWWALAAVFVRVLDREPTCDRLDRWALALPVGLGCFTLAQAPVLLLHGSWRLANLLSLVVMLAMGAVAWWGWTRHCSASKEAEQLAETASDAGDELRAVPADPREVPVGIVIGLTIAAGLIGGCFAGDVGERRWWLVCAVGVALVSAIVGWRCRMGLSGSDPRKPTEPVIPSASMVRSCRALCLGSLVVAFVLGLLWTREDLDDVLYLSHAVELPGAAAIGEVSPDHHGEQLPANPLYALHAFELWGAQWCAWSGVSVLAGFRTLLAPVLWLGSLLLLRRLLRRWLPGWLVPVALTLVVAYLTIGASSHWAANNLFFPRPQQGKTWLVHLFLPALWVAWPRFGGARIGLGGRWRRVALGILVGAGACGCAPTAIFLVPCWAIGLFVVGVAARKGRAFLTDWATPFATALAVSVPCALLGLYVLAVEQPELREVAVHWDGELRWLDALLFHTLGARFGGGAIELAVLQLAPLGLATWSRGARGTREEGECGPAALAPGVVLGAVLLTVASPVLAKPLAQFITGSTGYPRVFWLLPFALAFAWHGAWLLQGVHRRGAAPMFFVGWAALVGALPLLGGKPWFSPDNVYRDDVELEAPVRTRNLERVPAGLAEIARWLDRRGRSERPRRVLCEPHVAAHLAPWSRHISFVYTRSFQTGYALAAAGREDELRARERLAECLGERAHDGDEIESLLHAVEFDAVVRKATKDGNPPLSSAAFQLAERADGYELWLATERR